jgi:hypothetical protein
VQGAPQASTCQLASRLAAAAARLQVDILLANPLRLVHLLEEGKVQLDQVGAQAWRRWLRSRSLSMCREAAQEGRNSCPALLSAIDHSVKACSLHRPLAPPPLASRIWQRHQRAAAPPPQVRHFVMDEADKLFEMGFMEQVDALLAAASHPSCVRSLFSATLPEKVEELARCALRCACAPLPAWPRPRPRPRAVLVCWVPAGGQRPGRLVAAGRRAAAACVHGHRGPRGAPV